MLLNFIDVIKFYILNTLGINKQIQSELGTFTSTKKKYFWFEGRRSYLLILDKIYTRVIMRLVYMKVYTHMHTPTVKAIFNIALAEVRIVYTKRRNIMYQ